jgi:hypothetical protein
MIGVGSEMRADEPFVRVRRPRATRPNRLFGIGAPSGL